VDRKHANLNFASNALSVVVQSLRPAFLDHQSTSLMITGSNSEALSLVLQAQRILLRENRCEWLLTGTNQNSLIARITGNLNDSDAAAIISLADQFCIRSGRDRNVNAVLEDLGVFFRQCKSDGTPALILIEDFHLFAHQKRQTLIYTLLDLLHRADYLFAVIGITERLDAFSGLEKRVASRMSSQNAVISFPAVQEICAEMHWLLTLRPRSSHHKNKRKRPSPHTKDGTSILFHSDDEGEEEGLLNDREEPVDTDEIWRQSYNRSVETLFGEFVLRPVLIPKHRLQGIEEKVSNETAANEMDVVGDIPAGNKENEANQADSAVDGESITIDSPVPNVHELSLFSCVASSPSNFVHSSTSKPAAWEVIRRQLNFGRGRRFFAKAVLNLLTLLPLDAPNVTLEQFQRALEMNEPPNLAQLLSSLSLAELSLYAVMGRLQCQPGNALKAPRQLVMEDVLGDYDRLTGGYLSITGASAGVSAAGPIASRSQKQSSSRPSLQHVIEMLRRLMSLGVVTLWSGMRGRPLPPALLQSSLIPSVVVTVEHTADEITAAFTYSTTSSPSAVSLVMPERVRAAVLRPVVPLVYAAPPSTINSSSMTTHGRTNPALPHAIQSIPHSNKGGAVTTSTATTTTTTSTLEPVGTSVETSGIAETATAVT
jgi:hypothetical protein